MGVTLDANGKGAIITKAPLGSPRPKRQHDRPHRKAVPNRGKSNRSSENGGRELEKKRDKRRGFVFEPALEDGTTVEPLETIIAPLRMLGNVLEGADDGENGHMVSVTEYSDGEVSPVNSCEDSPGIFDDPIDKMRWSFLTPPRPQENVHGALGGTRQMTGGIACSLADTGQKKANPKQETPKQGKATPSPTANLAGPVIDRKAPESGNHSSPPTRPPPRSLPSVPGGDEEVQARRRPVKETVEKFERKISTSPKPSPPVLGPVFAKGKNGSVKSPKHAPVKKTKRPIPPPLVLRKTGPSRPPGLPPIVIEQKNADIDLPAPAIGLYADRGKAAPKTQEARLKPQKPPIKAPKAPETPKGPRNLPPVPARPQSPSLLIVSVSPPSAPRTPVLLQLRAAQNDDIPTRIRDPLTGIQYIPPAAPSPPMSPPAGRSRQDEENCIEEEVLKEVLSLEASRKDFSQYLATRSNGNDGKLLELYMAAKAHEEALNLVMKLSEEIQVIATQIPFFKLDKSNYPENITMAQKEAFRRMVEEFPTYLMTSSSRPIERQRELEERMGIGRQRDIECEVERELGRERRGRGEQKRRELQREIEKERERASMEGELGRGMVRKLETAEGGKAVKGRERRGRQTHPEKDPGLKLQKPKEKARHLKCPSAKTTQSQVAPVMEEESFGDMSYPNCIDKPLITKDGGPLSLIIHREKKALPDSLSSTMSAAQAATTKSHQKLPTPVRRRRSTVRVAPGSERKVHIANSIQRKSLLPQQSHSSRHSLRPSIERAPSFSSSASESEPEPVNDCYSKVSISDSIGNCHGEGGAPGPAYSSNRMSFAFTRDEVIRLSKVLEGEDHLRISGGEEYGGIVEKLLDLRDDEVDHKRDTTIGLYDLYDC
ncbi:hypothetical protein C7212DRAFT_361065 [Tuber magnatum]|uniref:Uncharacterized protein n=1 Tax=Tuber magnatum TaxID=42249 RepID=A0A317T043_9PEZI|nr:hypothetical protein C7212DRAFT_361065 [Tuber magnatum]